MSTPPNTAIRSPTPPALRLVGDLNEAVSHERLQIQLRGATEIRRDKRNRAIGGKIGWGSRPHFEQITQNSHGPQPSRRLRRTRT
jgi:hypothetical protein